MCRNLLYKLFYLWVNFKMTCRACTSSTPGLNKKRHNFKETQHLDCMFSVDILFYILHLCFYAAVYFGEIPGVKKYKTIIETCTTGILSGFSWFEFDIFLCWI